MAKNIENYVYFGVGRRSGNSCTWLRPQKWLFSLKLGLEVPKQASGHVWVAQTWEPRRISQRSKNSTCLKKGPIHVMKFFQIEIFISLDISNSQKVIKIWNSQNKQHTHVFWHIWPLRHLGNNLLGVISFGNSHVNWSCKLDQIWELRKISSFHWMCFLVYLFPQPVSIVCWLVSKSY